jgi:hypothetical protein
MSTSASETSGIGTDAPGLSDEELIQKIKNCKTMSKIGRLAVPLAILAGFVVFGMNTGRSFTLDEFFYKFIVPAGVVLVVLFFVDTGAKNRASELQKLLGAAITLPILREAFEVKDYTPRAYIGEKWVKESELMPQGDRRSGSDYTEGIYRGINFIFSDLHLEHKEKDQDGDEVYVTHFKGLWLVCDFGRALAGTLLLKEWQMGRPRGKPDIETESVEFNEKFEINAKDAHSAFLLLTPHVMERLMAFDELARATTSISFRKNGRVHIALDGRRDTFDVKRMNADDLAGLRERFRADIHYLTGIMDALLQNDKLLKKE